MKSDTAHTKGSVNNNIAKPSNSASSLNGARRLHRRSFLRNVGLGAVLFAPGAGLLTGAAKTLAAPSKPKPEPRQGRLTQGDVAILQLLAAAELIEADLWQQYNELGGVDAPTSGYTAGLS